MADIVNTAESTPKRRYEDVPHPQTKIEKRIRVSAILIVLALVLEAISLAWLHPAAFLLLHMGAMGLFVLAIAVYLLSLLPGDKAT
jgi:hypothetical protein